MLIDHHNAIAGQHHHPRILHDFNQYINIQHYYGLTPEAFINSCLDIHHEFGLDLIIVDTLQLIASRGESNRADDSSMIYEDIKTLAVKLNIPILSVLTLSHLLDTLPNKRPSLPLLRPFPTLNHEDNDYISQDFDDD